MPQKVFKSDVNHGLPSKVKGEKAEILKFKKGEVCPPELAGELAHVVEDYKAPTGLVAPTASELRSQLAEAEAKEAQAAQAAKDAEAEAAKAAHEASQAARVANRKG